MNSHASSSSYHPSVRFRYETANAYMNIATSLDVEQYEQLHPTMIFPETRCIPRRLSRQPVTLQKRLAHLVHFEHHCIFICFIQLNVQRRYSLSIRLSFTLALTLPFAFCTSICGDECRRRSDIRPKLLSKRFKAFRFRINQILKDCGGFGVVCGNEIV